jgi:hypothetical protein
MAKAWVDLEHSQPEPDAQQNILRETGCSEKTAPYVIQGFIFQGGVTSRYNGIAFNKTEPFGGPLRGGPCSFSGDRPLFSQRGKLPRRARPIGGGQIQSARDPGRRFAGIGRLSPGEGE